MRGFIVTLSNGLTIDEDEIRAKFPEQSPWLSLQNEILVPGIKIVDLQLGFDHQRVFLPKYRSVYFYARKVEAYLNIDAPQTLYYGVGAVEDNTTNWIDVTWYDGSTSYQEWKKYDPENPCFIKS